MDETGTPPGDPQVTVKDGIVEAAPSWDDLEPTFRGSITTRHVIRLFKDRPAVQVLASHYLDADRVRVTCAQRDALDLVGSGIFTATITRAVPLPVDYGIGGVWDDEPTAAAVDRTRLRLAREALVGTGYFSEDEVGPDVAPRITELWSAMGNGQTKDKSDPRVMTVVATLPEDVDGSLAHAVIELLSQRWPMMKLRGRSDGTIEVRIDPGTDQAARRRVL